MALQLNKRLFVLTLSVFFMTACCESDWDFQFCGTWRHGGGLRQINVNISTGCRGISVEANQGLLSISGEVTAQCQHSRTVFSGLLDSAESHFCLYWEPFFDQMKFEFGNKNFTLCWPASLKGLCCTDLSHGSNGPEGEHGIVNGTVKNDLITHKTLKAYHFNGSPTDCKKLCDQEIQRSTSGTMGSVGAQPAEAVGHPCARSFEVLMKEDFKGHNMTSPRAQAREPAITVQIPPDLKYAAKNTTKVVCTFFQNNSLFQDTPQDVRILDDVVEITVENEVIRNLTEKISIVFRHDVIRKSQKPKCVSWDTTNAPLQVNWTTDGCETRRHGPERTQCLCNHLTYFSVLVQLQPGPVCHLLALSVITSFGCAVSLLSCVGLMVYICRKRFSKDQSTPIHLGLTVSLAFLNLLFFLTGVLANVVDDGQKVCVWVAAGLHYALLTSLTWMGIEVLHTFRLVYMVFRPIPRPYVWNLVGFVLPAALVSFLVAVGDIYGVRKLRDCDEDSDPYQMCWMKDTERAWLAHYLTNIPVLLVLVVSGSVMLVLVFRQIRRREEWRQNYMAFISMWGLSSLFGITWILAFFSFGPLKYFFYFFFCIINSFQGFFLMLRFVVLHRLRNKSGGSSLGSSSTGSTRQHMLQAPEKS